MILRDFADNNNDRETVRVLEEILAMTVGQARQLGLDGTLEQVLNGYYEHMSLKLGPDWLPLFAETLNLIAETGNEG
jgi:hypothetical protein